MGNRSYLFNKEGHMLFEANNSLPLFWLGLLNSEMLEQYQVVWEEYEREDVADEDGTDEAYHFWMKWTERLEFVVTREDFLKNTAKLAAFSQQSLGQLHGLTTDFLTFLEKQLPTPSDFLRLSLLEFSDFYESVVDFFSFLRKQVEMISHNQPSKGEIAAVLANPIEEGTGFATYAEGPDFAAFSINYQDWERPVPTTNLIKGKNNQRQLFVILLIVFTILIGLILLLMLTGSQKKFSRVADSSTFITATSASETDKNTQFEVGNERVELDLPQIFDSLSEGDISDANGNSWLVMTSEDVPNLLLELSIKNKESSASPQSYSLTDLDLGVVKKEKVDYHGFSQEVLMTLSQEKGFVYEFETEGTMGTILFASDTQLKAEEEVLFEQLIDSLAVTQTK